LRSDVFDTAGCIDNAASGRVAFCDFEKRLTKRLVKPQSLLLEAIRATTQMCPLKPDFWIKVKDNGKVGL
jgi:hypothetical protein